ncbi:MAG: hypothetical protein N2316_03400 [Spirochaetes bacterium]|nr:hypothetical protein [Spirochaetota bacterium]
MSRAILKFLLSSRYGWQNELSGDVRCFLLRLLQRVLDRAGKHFAIENNFVFDFVAESAQGTVGNCIEVVVAFFTFCYFHHRFP